MHERHLPRLVIILAVALALWLTGCLPGDAAPGPVSTTSPAATVTPVSTGAALSLAVDTLADLRRVVSLIAGAEPSQAQALSADLYRSLVQSRRIPLIFDRQVVFLYYGRAQSVSWQGVFNGWGNRPGLAGSRVGQTDLWLAQSEFPAASRAEYKLLIDDKDWMVDPGNPATVPSGDTTNNVFSLDGFVVTDVSQPRDGIAHGDLGADVSLSSTSLGYTVNYRVYTPAGYEHLGRLPALYVLDGNDWSDPRMGALPTVLDNLIAVGQVPPVLAVFVDAREPGQPAHNRRETEFLALASDYAHFIARELVPAVDSSYRTRSLPGARVIVGVSFGGLGATYIAAAYPDVFYNLAAFSPSLWALNPGAFSDPVKSAAAQHMFPVFDALTNCGGTTATPCRRQPLRIFATSGYPQWDVGDLNALVPLNEARGYSVRLVQVQEGHAWSAWRGLADEMLLYFATTAFTAAAPAVTPAEASSASPPPTPR